MKINRKNKINNKYQRRNSRRLGATACLIDGSTIDVVNTAFTAIGGLVALSQIPSSFRIVKNGIRRNVIGRFIDAPKDACKVVNRGKVCNASTKLIAITLKGGKPFFARQCTENPLHLVDPNGVRIKFSNLSEKQQSALFS